MHLHVSNVDKGYGETVVLKRISFEVNPHEFVCILGHSGCGKSTLLNLIAGYIQPDGGTITVDGEKILKPSKTRGVVFQDHALFPWCNVVDNISFGPEVQGKSKKDAKEIAFNYLKLVGLEKFAQHFPDQLSGGMKQRVGIARALAGEPEILLMDEPFGALDILTREMMRKELMRIWLKLRPMVIFITHSISEAIHLADKIIVMKHGEVSATFQVTMDRPRSYKDVEFVNMMVEIERILTDEDAISEE